MFDIGKFQNTDLQLRTREVPMTALPDKFFPEGAEKKFKVRQLTGNEIAACNEAVNATIQARALVEKIMAGSAKEKAAAICESMGLSAELKPESVREMNWVHQGIVEPEGFGYDQVVRLHSFYYVDFKQLFNAVISLTGMGADAGE